MVGVMHNALFGTSLRVPLLMIARCQNEHFLCSRILSMHGGSHC